MKLVLKIALLSTFTVLAGQLFAEGTGSKARSAAAAVNPTAEFTKTVQPFIASNCLACHNSKSKVANVDLEQFTSVDSVRTNLKLWKKVAWKLQVGEMPPKSSPRPKVAAQKAVLKWVNAEVARTQTVKP